MASIPRIKVCRNETRTPARPGCAQRPGRAGVLAQVWLVISNPRVHRRFTARKRRPPRRRCDDVGLSCGCAIRHPRKGPSTTVVRPSTMRPPAEPQHEVLIQQLLEPLLLAVGQKRATRRRPQQWAERKREGTSGACPARQDRRNTGTGSRRTADAAQDATRRPACAETPPWATKQAERMEGSTSLRQARAAASSETVTRKGDTASRTRASLKTPPPPFGSMLLRQNRRHGVGHVIAFSHGTKCRRNR